MRSRVLFSLLALLLLGADLPKWRLRRRSGVTPNRRAAQLIAPSAWQSEPEAPADIDPARFARTLREVCGLMPPGRPEHYAQWILESAARYGEDPFLLAALMVRASRCLPDARTVEGVGLTAIQPAMYLDNVRGRTLRYPVLEAGTTRERALTLDSMLAEPALLVAEHHFAWAAALLAMWREQHALVDARYEQLPHRHYVSHFVWGDRVKSARAEDRVFTDRRRLLLHYGIALPVPTHVERGVTWGSPLEGAPRVVSSEPGADRDEGLRRHRGVDIEASLGEPVLAIADGRVAFSGVDLPGGAHALDLPLSKIASVPRSQLGRGGRYVCITHLDAHGDESWLRSCSMHLEEVRVHTGQTVRRGDTIGTVGRTGMKRSAPHLHLEIKSDKRLYDARDVLAGILIGEPPAEPMRKQRKRLPAAASFSRADSREP